jgi:carboxyl-terminal processing protease
VRPYDPHAARDAAIWSTSVTNRKWYEWSLLGVLGVAVAGSTVALTRPDYAFFDPMIGIKSLITQRYVTQPDEKQMQQGAINGMLEVLNDPYTVYVPPSDTREFSKELTGDFVGIGVQIETRDGWLTVVTPLEDTPAFKAGLMAGDRITDIDGKSTFSKTSDECVEMLQGEPGKSVAITVERAGKKMPVTLVRERIVARTVKGFHWEPQGDKGSWQYFMDPGRKIAYLRLTQFTPTSAAELAQALESVNAEGGGLGGLILDLRWNPGGVLEDAIQIADLFLREGVIVSTKGRAHPEDIVRAQAEGTLPDFAMAVLINGQSASASEVLTGALVENKRAIAVGTRSFGKGLVQTVHSISPGGGQLKITEQRYYLPSGRCIQRSDDSAEWGVDPTVGFYVPMTDDETVAMLRVRRSEEAIGGDRHGDGADKWSDPAWIVERLKDPQLAAALKAVQGRIDSKEWTPTGKELPAGSTLAAQDLERTTRLRDRLERELGRLDRKIDALEAVSAPPQERPDLWPDTAQVAGGHVEVFDKDGKLLARLKVVSPDLERWLIDADLRPDDAAKPAEPSHN